VLIQLLAAIHKDVLFIQAFFPNCLIIIRAKLSLVWSVCIDVKSPLPKVVSKPKLWPLPWSRSRNYGLSLGFGLGFSLASVIVFGLVNTIKLSLIAYDVIVTFVVLNLGLGLGVDLDFSFWLSGFGFSLVFGFVLLT